MRIKNILDNCNTNSTMLDLNKINLWLTLFVWFNTRGGGMSAL